GDTTKCRRDSGQRRDGDRGGNAGNDVDFNSVAAEVLPLFGPSGEDHRIAALEPDHGLRLPRVADHQAVDPVLNLLLLALPLAAVDEGGMGRERKNLDAHQTVVDHDV